MWPFKRITRATVRAIEPNVCKVSDYDETYTYVKKVFVCIGLRLMRKDEPFVKLFWNVVYWIEFFNMFIPIMLDFILLRNILQSGFDDITLVFQMLPCVGYMILAMLKTYKIVYQRPVFENLVDELRSMWPQGEVSEEEYDIVTRSLNEINFFVKAYYYCNYALVLSISIPPYMDVVKRCFGWDIPRVLPYNYWTPFDSSQPGWFEFTLFMQSWETMITVWCMLVGDILFCVFLSHITVQLDLLCVKIKRVFYVPVDQQLIPEYPLGKHDGNVEGDDKQMINCYTPEQNEKYEKDLIAIISRHRALLRLSNDVEDLFSFALFFNFFFSSIIICFCGFCSVVIEKWNEFMYKTFLVSALAQTWLLCLHGQKLIESSQRVSDALYNCGWYVAPIYLRKSIHIMIHRSQKSAYITTYGFSIVSLNSYSSIIKTAWSYFTLLRNTYEV